MIHHGFKQGKRVLIIMKSGEKVIGKFLSSNANSIVLDSRKIPLERYSCNNYK